MSDAIARDPVTGPVDFLHLVQVRWRAVAKEISPMILLTTNRSIGATIEQEGYPVQAWPFHLKEFFDKVKRAMNQGEEVLEIGVNFHPSERGFHDH